MRVNFRGEPPPIERLYEIAFPADLAPPALPLPSVSATPILVDAQADVDISDPAFDFLRSIRVHQIEYWQRKDGEGSCHRATKLWLGTYGTQGDFNWARRADNIIPEAVDFRPPSGCHHYEYNSVFVEWKDFLGKEDNLEVRY